MAASQSADRQIGMVSVRIHRSQRGFSLIVTGASALAGTASGVQAANSVALTGPLGASLPNGYDLGTSKGDSAVSVGVSLPPYFPGLKGAYYTAPASLGLTN